MSGMVLSAKEANRKSHFFYFYEVVFVIAMNPYFRNHIYRSFANSKMAEKVDS